MADLIVDTYKLNQYAGRLSSVNGRLKQIDYRLDSLYWRVGLLGLWNLIQADIFTSYSWRLERCKIYLEQTAFDFENLEKELDYDKFKSTLSNQNIHFSWNDFNFDIPIMTNNPPGIEEKIPDIMKEYFDLIKSDKDITEKTRGVIKWLSSIKSSASTYKDYVEWLSGCELKWPKPIATGFDFIKALNTSDKLIFGILKYGEGFLNGDLDSMTDGANDLLGALKTGIAETIKTDIKMTDFLAGLLLDYGENMISNWITSIQTETEISEVYWNTFAKSAYQVAIKVCDDTVFNTQTLAIAYTPAILLSNAVGFDLQGAYEKVSDKKGVEAVTDTFSQVKDVVMENCSWKNWKSGMSAIIDGVVGWFK